MTLCLFYNNKPHFSNLTIDQINFEERDGKSCLVYTECVSKTYKGGLRDIRTKPKVVIQYASDDPTRCHVKLYQKFLSVRPTGVARFYLMPISTARNDMKTWYTKRPIGKNSLAKYMKEICFEAGLKIQATNHSLRATCATRLYQAGVDEQQIMERTGHKSTAGVRTYKRTSDVHIQVS